MLFRKLVVFSVVFQLLFSSYPKASFAAPAPDQLTQQYRNFLVALGGDLAKNPFPKELDIATLEKNFSNKNWNDKQIKAAEEFLSLALNFFNQTQETKSLSTPDEPKVNFEDIIKLKTQAEEDLSIYRKKKIKALTIGVGFSMVILTMYVFALSIILYAGEGSVCKDVFQIFFPCPSESQTTYNVCQYENGTSTLPLVRQIMVQWDALSAPVPVDENFCPGEQALLAPSQDGQRFCLFQNGTAELTMRDVATEEQKKAQMIEKCHLVEKITWPLSLASFVPMGGAGCYIGYQKYCLWRKTSEYRAWFTETARSTHIPVSILKAFVEEIMPARFKRAIFRGGSPAF
jgi:hypothetical protein